MIPAAGGLAADPQSHRIPWTASQVRGSPDPPPPLKTVTAYPHLKFTQPTALVAAPGTNRVFVTELGGKIYSFPDDPDCLQADLFFDVADLVAQLDAEQPRGADSHLAVGGLYGIAFHPDFDTNRQVFLSFAVGYEKWELNPTFENGARIVRLTAPAGDPPRADPLTAVTLLTWRPGGHQGGCLAFGPDGYLYASTGDGGDPVPPDGLKTGQDVGDLMASILRLDVDRVDGDRPYAIPPDNPLVAVPGARGEIYAYGMRNPWKFSFDRQTGGLWVGDVGWESWEWIYKVKPGDNFGWSVNDGTHPLHADWPRGPTPIVPPTVEISHSDAASITGGYVYRGKRLPQLVGKYVFGDWQTRHIWAIDAERPAAAGMRDLVEPSLRIIAFGEQADGELLVLDFDDGTIHTLVENDAAGDTAPFPTALGQTGLFADTARLEPMPGVLPFEVAAEAWADHATAVRHVAVPGEAPILLHAAAKPVKGSQFSSQLHFPAGTVLAKTFSLEMEHGRPETARRIETQLLHFNGRVWRGYTYAWNEQQTDAELVLAAGRRVELTVADPQSPEGLRRQEWVFHGRSECIRCHNPWAETALAFNVPQLNRDVARGGRTENQLARFRHAGILADAPLPVARTAGPAAPDRWPGPEETLPKLADPRDLNASLPDRARSYLHVNCGHCHRFGGGGSATVLLNRELPLEALQAVGVPPRQGSFGIDAAEIIAAGRPYRSTLLYRMATAGPGRMPHIGSELVDAAGLALIHDWIGSLADRPDDDAAIDQLLALDDHDGPDDTRRRQLVATALGSTGRALRLSKAVLDGRVSPATRAAVLAAVAGHPDPLVLGLFEQHLPAAARVRRLGTQIDPAVVLGHTGDANRGRTLFRESRATQCRNCHAAEAVGRGVGPPLDGIGARRDRTDLLDSILWPSRKIDPAYQAWTAQLEDGRVVAGLLVERSRSRVVLRDVEGRERTIQAAEIDVLQPVATSLMPEHQFRDLTAAEAADILAYLESLR